MKILRKRKSVSGLDAQEELKCWSMTFKLGADYFRDLKKIGIAQDAMDHGSFLKLAEEAWTR